MSRVAVVGGGAAGMMAACAAAMDGHEVTLFEHNEKLGKKLYITGKGRCNLTNACAPDELFDHIPRNGRFLYSAFSRFDNRAVMDFFENHGLRLKKERGGRVFPQSDHSSDVIRALEQEMQRAGVRVILHTEVTDLEVRDGRIRGLRFADSIFRCDAVIMATGGVSYPSTGSDGSGMSMVKRHGHTCTALRPSLVGMKVKEGYIRELAGLSLKNITLTFQSGNRKIYEEFGELLFTHQGISGPTVLTASSRIPDKYFSEELIFEIDLKPSLAEEQLDHRVLRDFEENANRQYKNSLGKLLPAKIIPAVIRLSGIDPEKRVNSVTKEERHCLVTVLKHFPGTAVGPAGWDEAIITRGGIRVKEVNPSTMESKILHGLYFCGEMLDLDAVTGGFNLQIAWSTGYLAGKSIP